ncbi:MAG: serine/threonine protein kinase [Acidobacteria bacterium]|nr:serine/threonine protein kinase [Acidobacteriota bacterium]
MVLRVLVSVGAWLSGYPIAPADAPLGSLTGAALFVCYGTTGALLLTVGQRDERARYLGAFFLVIASAFAREPAEALAMTSGPGVLREFATLRYDPLLPLYFSLFVSRFPRHASESSYRPCDLLVALCASFAGLAGTTAIIDWGTRGGRLITSGMWLQPSDAYWTIIFGLLCGGLILLLWRSRTATGAERVRAVWFSVGLAVGLIPLCAAVLLYASSETFKALTLRPDVRSAFGAFIAVGLLTIPPSTMYSVAVRQVLEIRIVIRRALRCALAKVATVGLCLLPLVLLAWTAYASRSHTIAGFAQDPWGRLLIAAASIGILGMVVVHRLLGWLERVILHGPYDSFAAISDLRQRLETAANPAAVVDHTRRVIEATLRPASVTAVYAAYRGAPFSNTTSGTRALAADSSLVEVLTRSTDAAVPVTDALLRFVGTSDAAWLSGSCAEHLLCIRLTGEIVGIIALAERSSERPYNVEDCRFLAELSQTAAVHLQHLPRRQPSQQQDSRGDSSTRPAMECSGCGEVSGPDIVGTCPACGHPLDFCQLPPIVGGKFRIQRRIGRGGMGIVYLAKDERLQRDVAVKTLPYISVAAERRLEREAQFMARVSHPHVASIYSLEAWGDRPVLVTEYLSGGTLQTRLLTGRPQPNEVVSWGLQLAQGLTRLHREGLVHGDLKPSNIGFDAVGAAKLLDFGLAETAADRNRNVNRVLSTANQAQFGTPFYACPEMDERPPCPSFDLWGLALVLYEALAGRASIHATANGRPKLPLVPLTDLHPDVSTTLSHFFVRALSAEPALRPSSAAEFGLWLRRSAPITAVSPGAPYSSL